MAEYQARENRNGRCAETSEIFNFHTYWFVILLKNFREIFGAGLYSKSLPAHKIKIQVLVNGREIIDVTGDEVSTDSPRRQRD